MVALDDRVVVPDGKATGCLPRRWLPGRMAPLFGERIKVIPPAEWPERLSGPGLRPLVKRVLDQDGEGSCATESCTQGVHIIREFQGQPFELLNPWFVYHHTMLSGGGSEIDVNLDFIRSKGIAPQAIWPRSKGVRAKPTEEAYVEALRYRIDEFFDLTTIAEVGTALLMRLPVIFGWQGHSCVLTQLLDERTAEYCNSWTPFWGDGGFGKIWLSSINFRYGAFAVRTVVDAGRKAA